MGADSEADSREVARELYSRGYFPLVIRPESKSPAVKGFSGHSRPTRSRIESYIETIAPRAPIAVSVPIGVVGVDVDTYGDKTGGTTLCELESELGELPDTWMSTRRGPQPASGDKRSGIYLFQLPLWAVQADGEELVKLASTFGPGIETVQYHERIVVCAPTVLDGMPYLWWAPGVRTTSPRSHADEPETDWRYATLDGIRASLLPAPVTELPVLPDAWVRRFYRSGLSFSDGRPVSGSMQQLGDAMREWNDDPEAWSKHTRKMRRSRADTSSGGGAAPATGLSGVSSYRAMGLEEALQWASANVAGWDEEPNEFMRRKTEQLLADFGSGASRHDYTRDAIWHARRSCAGDAGVSKPANAGGAWAVQRVYENLIDARDREAGGRDPQVREEVSRMVVHGIAKLRGDADSGSVTLADDLYGAPGGSAAGEDDYPDWLGNPDGSQDADVLVFEVGPLAQEQLDSLDLAEDFELSLDGKLFVPDEVNIDLSEIDLPDTDFDAYWADEDAL